VKKLRDTRSGDLAYGSQLDSAANAQIRYEELILEALKKGRRKGNAIQHGANSSIGIDLLRGSASSGTSTYVVEFFGDRNSPHVVPGLPL
jgi:hypothetical protein